jgi:hypothetical protein
LPTGLAAVVTLLNAAKPAVVDDSAYLFFARQAAAHPLDPYGFELFWYDEPMPAMKVLAPPMLPYWLGAGIALFGEDLLFLKFWLFPFPLVLFLAVGSLLRRFAAEVERTGLVMLALSAAVAPMLNVMLDVPAVALGTAAVATFVSGCDGRRVGWVVAAGTLAGLAAQTKYTMLTVPAVFAWYGLCRRQYGYSVLAGVVATALFTSWELLLGLRYGESHFLHHVGDQEQSGGLTEWLCLKSTLFRPLVAHLGLLALGWGLYAGRAVGFGRWLVAAVGAVAAGGLLAVAFVPVGTGRYELASSVFHPLGAAVLVSVGLAVIALLRRDRGAWFLVGWLGIELAAYFVLTPFPATRRVVPLCVVIGLVACRLASQARPDRKPERWIVAYSVAVMLGLQALDVWDALPEKRLAEQAAAAVGDRGPHRVWTQGHWGWQYYTDREGMRLVVPGRSELKAGDWLVFPVIPDREGFYRPYHGEATFPLDPAALEWVAEYVWDDPIPAQTVPSLYGGGVPVGRREHPRLRVVVYRVIRDWVPATDR